MSHLIQVFEYEKLKANDVAFFPDETVGKKVIDKLWQYNDSHNNIYFDAIRNGVKFKQYVGVIQIGNITIEILPKSDKHKSTKADKKTWHDVLLKMLVKCKKIRVDSVSEATLRKRFHSLLDLYFELYLQEVNYLLEQGLIKKYHKQSGNLKILKGRLEFSKNVQHNLVHKERFYTSHQVYDINHNINQILYKGLIVLKSITNNNALTDKINRTLSRFPQVDNKSINKTHFDSLVANRKTTLYQEAIKIAKMIILNYSPDIKGGNEHMIALLFDMNKLWEEYVYRMLVKHQNKNLKVNFQNSNKFWENTRIKPDIVLTKTHEDGVKETFVIDTKWKVLDAANPKPSDNDLKQMFAYNLYWDANKSMLLYPHTSNIDENFGKYWKGRANPLDNQCKVGFINVLDENNQLNFEIGENIIKKLINCQ
ncbi:McrC family protein [Cellulophaga sp. Z1A5H]|uniref:McrC family protein n=1 Tax=Cellulophaga sp. Z1A5H TaxID=2687291 RepID=UPI0013FD9F06|nr:restriction endonuclease [Cellulophaga sp. Z1A5H]